MKRVTGIGGIFFAAKDPQKLWNETPKIFLVAARIPNPNAQKEIADESEAESSAKHGGPS